jgi:hypothetical protein
VPKCLTSKGKREDKGILQIGPWPSEVFQKQLKTSPFYKYKLFYN